MAIVHQVEFGNLADIPKLMETVAAELRAGEYGEVRSGVCVLLGKDGTPHVFGWGADADDVHAIGLLTLGAAWVGKSEVVR
jgi:hypothetical protein